MAHKMESSKAERSSLNRAAYANTVESLYRASQPSYSNSGGFLIEDSNKFGGRFKNKNNLSDLSDDESDLEDGLAKNDNEGGFMNTFVEDGSIICLDCSKPFTTSHLHVYFAHPVCDACKNTDEVHFLITRTDAKQEFLLKDCDLDQRKPRLKFISRKNPHNPRWGDMKLYLKSQVEKRAIEIWGSLDELNEAKEQRDKSKIQMKAKRFDKKMKELRQQVRSDLYKKPLKSHEHEYGEEIEDKNGESFYKLCKVCAHKFHYEKL